MKRHTLYLILSGFLYSCISTILIAQETSALKPALSARVSFTDLNDNQLLLLPRGEPFNITVSIDNAIGNEPPAGLYLSGWLRRHSQQNLDCQSAARAYLATGRTPIGSVDLNGPVIGVLTEDGHLTIADPDLDLASANLIGATSFDELPAGFVTDPDTNRFFVSLGKAGKLLAINAFGGKSRIIAEGLDQPGSLIAAGNGSIWVLEQGSGDLLLVHPDGSSRLLMSFVKSIGAGVHGHSFVAWDESQIHTFNRFTGERLIDALHLAVPRRSDKDFDKLELESGNSSSFVDAIPIEDRTGAFAVATLAGSTVSLHYLDDPDNPIYIKLITPAQQLAVDRSGRFLFAFAPEGGDTSIIDISRSRVAQVVGAGIPVIDIQFTDNAAFLMLADQSMVGVMELASIKTGQHAKVREVDLGQVVPYDNGSQRKLMAQLAPFNEILAVHAKSFTGFIIHETSAMGDAPPMSAIKLRGGVPHQIGILDRSFHETSTGTFRTTAMLPAKGEFELVVTAGIGSLSACMPMDIAAGQSVADREPGTISIVQATATNNGRQGTRLRLNKADGEPVQLLDAQVTFSALEANWRYRADLKTDNTGLSEISYDLPALGEYVITISSATARDFKPLLFRAN